MGSAGSAAGGSSGAECSAAALPRARLQLLGATAYLVAMKLLEDAAAVTDLCYICDGAYDEAAVRAMEVELVRALDGDVLHTTQLA